ncbi:hypothetical protein D3C76_1728480 [compost metagenome]
MPLFKRQPAQGFDPLIKHLPIPAHLGKQSRKRRHPLVIQTKWQQLGVVHRRIDPGVIAPFASPLTIAQRPVITAQAFEFGLFAGAFA